MNIPLVLIIYKRPGNIGKLLSSIASYKPSKIYIVADGPKNSLEKTPCNQARIEAEKNITWECEVIKIYASKNLGLRERIVSGLNQVFKNEKQAIILEDDLIVDPSFFQFCEDLLVKYADDDRIISISGNNFQFDKNKIKESYYFSKYVHSWGWATWRRSWKLFDNEMKDWPKLRESKWLHNIFKNKATELYWKKIFNMTIANEFDSWAYRWTYSSLLNKQLTIIPKHNLVSNIGYGKNATHTKRKSRNIDLPTKSILFPLTHQKKIEVNEKADLTTEKNIYLTPIIVLSLLVRSILKKIR